MRTRREMLGALCVPPGVAIAAMLGAEPRLAAGQAESVLARASGTPEEVARDEAFWRGAQEAFTVDRSIVNLNNGGVSPSPAVVQSAMRRRLDRESSVPPPVVLWQEAPPLREALRQRLAREFGCEAEELAITRNSSEGLQTCQLGIDLHAGDEVVTTTQDYPRMVNAFKQRQAREGIVLRQIRIPVPCENPELIVQLFEQAITPRTRLILVSHMINLTGQVLPVAEIVAMARRRGVAAIVDGAHALAHLDFRISDLGCDYYASSLHKWLFAPIGTGLLYVRRDRIGELWPLMAPPPEMRDDVRKFEEIGTHSAANVLAIGEALTFHQALGGARKEARLRYLRDSWATRLARHDRVHLHTSLKPGFAGGIATMEVQGIPADALQRHLWDKHRILTVAILHEEFSGIRVSPSVYTTMEELDRFVEATERIIAAGLPV